VINVVQAPLPFLRRSRYLVAANQVVLGQDARVVFVVVAELLINLVTANATEVVAFRIEEQAFDEGAGVGRGRRVSGRRRR